MRRIALVVAAALLSLTACGGVTSPQGGGGSPVGQVTVGNIFFRSTHNGSQNQAVDTIAAGANLTWTRDAAGSHTIQSTGRPPEIFKNNPVISRSHDTQT